MPQPNDYEWLKLSPFEYVCYPRTVPQHGAPHLRVIGVRSASGITTPRGDFVVWGAYWLERIGPAYRINQDGTDKWYNISDAMKAAVLWHRHDLESYSPQHDLDLQAAGYGNVPAG